MNVASILKSKGRNVTTATPDMTLNEVAKLLSDCKIGAAVVVGPDDRVEGIISERDIVGAISASGKATLQAPASEAMTKDVVACTEDSEIDDLMEMMTKGRFRHLPVLRDDRLVGIISIGDVVKFHLAEVEMEVSAMRSYLATG